MISFTKKRLATLFILLICLSVMFFGANQIKEVRAESTKEISATGVQIRCGDGDTYGRFQYLVVLSDGHQGGVVNSEDIDKSAFTPEKIKFYMSPDGEAISFANIYGNYIEHNFWAQPGTF